MRNVFRKLVYGGPLFDYYRFSRPLPSTRIREYVPGDYDRCSEIYSKNEVGRFPEGYLEKYQKHLEDNESIVIVLEEDSGVVGTGGICLHDYTDDISMAALSFGLIDPSYHGKGLGTMLMCARLCFLDPRSSWHLIMTSVGNGTEIFFKNLGFRFVTMSKDEEGTDLENYHVRALKSDLKRFRKLIDESGSEVFLNFNMPIPRIDLREEYRKMQLAQQEEWDDVG